MLLQHPVQSTIEDMKQAAKELSLLGCKYVLVKGGHVCKRNK